FYACKNLTRAEIPTCVIEYMAPYKIQSVSIINGEYIGEKAFEYYTNLADVTIGDSVKHVDENAFKDCKSNITNATITDVAIEAMQGLSLTLQSVTITKGIISARAFFQFEKLESITFGNEVTKICERAFNYCPLVTSITIPRFMTNIHSTAFDFCPGLEKITVEDGNTTYHSDGNCLIETNYKYLVLGCKTSVIPNDGSVTGITSHAFRGNSALTNLLIPDCITFIGQSAFEWCTNLRSIDIPDSVENIYESAFVRCGLVNVKLSNQIRYIRAYTFQSCFALESITIPDSVFGIYEDAFNRCTHLSSVTLSKNLKFIDDGAFTACPNLLEIYNKSSLNIVKGDYQYGFIGYQAKDIYTDEYVSKLSKTKEGFTLYTDGDDVMLISYSGLDSTVAIPDGTTEIISNAFAFCKNIVRIELPDSVKTIRQAAFSGCDDLKSIYIPSSVEVIEGSIFALCKYLTDIEFDGTKEQWDSIVNPNWNNYIGGYTLHCTDGDYDMNGNIIE
ncbi:MAG: leucine-rich repeat domain-containing protein, partial [Clostridia bacterium]|nr:leucine-rich repeat domain-containing protein [Clostridia bacterium]